MGMSIRTNVSALDAQKNLMGTENDLNSSLAKLSSGFRITKASDDAAGLAISVNLGAQIRSYNQSVRNANDAINVVQTADSSLNETQNILTRLRELASQSASSGVSNTERGYIQNEVSGLISEVDRIANATEYNGVALLNTSAALTFQVGIRNVAANDQIVVTTQSATASTLGINGAVAVDADRRRAGAGLHRHRAAVGVVDARHSGRAAEPIQHGDQRRDRGVGVAGGRQEPHHGRRCRRRDLEHEPHPDPDAGRCVGLVAGQPVAAGRAQAPRLSPPSLEVGAAGPMWGSRPRLARPMKRLTGEPPRASQSRGAVFFGSGTFERFQTSTAGSSSSRKNRWLILRSFRLVGSPRGWIRSRSSTA